MLRALIIAASPGRRAALSHIPATQLTEQPQPERDALGFWLLRVLQPRHARVFRGQILVWYRCRRPRHRDHTGDAGDCPINGGSGFGLNDRQQTMTDTIEDTTSDDVVDQQQLAGDCGFNGGSGLTREAWRERCRTGRSGRLVINERCSLIGDPGGSYPLGQR